MSAVCAGGNAILEVSPPTGRVLRCRARARGRAAPPERAQRRRSTPPGVVPGAYSRFKGPAGPRDGELDPDSSGDRASPGSAARSAPVAGGQPPADHLRLLLGADQPADDLLLGGQPLLERDPPGQVDQPLDPPGGAAAVPGDLARQRGRLRERVLGDPGGQPQPRGLVAAHPPAGERAPGRGSAAPGGAGPAGAASLPLPRRPVSASSLATSRPTSSGSTWVPVMSGTSPQCTSMTDSCASGCTSRMSAPSAICSPP